MGIKDIKVIGIVGAGTMGSGIALSYALGGYQVILYTRSEKSLNAGLNNIREALSIYQAEGQLSQKQCTEILKNIEPLSLQGLQHDHCAEGIDIELGDQRAELAWQQPP